MMDCVHSLEIARLVSGREPAKAGRADKVFNCRIPLRTDSLSLTIQVADRPARPSDLVPLARAMSDRITDACVREARQAGLCVPCRKGCSTCCHFLTAVSAPEAMRLSEDIKSLGGKQERTLLAACLDASKLILNAPPPPPGSGDGPDEHLRRLSRWYASLDLACHFLTDNACSIYANRPIACREFVVVSSPGQCGPEGTASSLDLPIRMSECMHELACQVAQADQPTLMLPLARLWAQTNPANAQLTRPADELVERLLHVVSRQASRKLAPVCRIAG